MSKSFEARMIDMDSYNTGYVPFQDALQIALEADALTKPPCKWTPYPDSSLMPGCHDTSCGQVNYLSEGTLADNDYKYCPYCGAEIEEVVK